MSASRPDFEAAKQFVKKERSDTGNRTPSCRARGILHWETMRGGNVNHYTISDAYRWLQLSHFGRKEIISESF